MSRYILFEIKETPKDLFTGRLWLNLEDFDNYIRAESLLEYLLLSIIIFTVRVSPPRQLLGLHTSKSKPPKVVFFSSSSPPLFSIRPSTRCPIFVFFFSARPQSHKPCSTILIMLVTTWLTRVRVEMMRDEVSLIRGHVTLTVALRRHFRPQYQLTLTQGPSLI